MNLKLTTLRAFALAVTLAAAAVVVEAQNVDPAVPGRAIIRVQEGASVVDAIAYIEQLCDSDLLCDATFDVMDVTLADRRLYLLSYLPSTAQVEGVLEGLAGDPANTTSDWGEQLYRDHDPESNTGSIWFFTGQGGDFFDGQYGADVIGVGSTQLSTTGQGMVVAVLDTGIDETHPLLLGSVAPGGFNFIDNNTITADPPIGHGTFVAGLIHLVAPDAMLLPVVVLNSDGIGDLWGLTRGLFHAIEQEVDVINLSLGSTYNSEAVGVALDEAKNLGIIVVAAGGNQNAGEAFEEFPAAQSNAFGVAAVDHVGVKWDEEIDQGSNYHSDFFISAPGASLQLSPDEYDPAATIYSTLPGGGYGAWEGTSMSTAFVSGGAALVLSQLSGVPRTEALVDALECRLASTVDRFETCVPPFCRPWDGNLGAGRLNLVSAVLLGDSDLDGVIGIVDFLALIEAWGPADGAAPCLVDLNADGIVGIQDLLILLLNWS